MKSPIITRNNLAKKNKKRMEELRDIYIEMFLEQLELNNAKRILPPDAEVYVELVEDWQKGLLTNEKRSEVFAMYACFLAAEKLNTMAGYKVRVKPGKIFTRNRNLKFARRLAGKVKLS